MSAELLRRAAALMRLHAQAACVGPWVVTEASDEFDDYGYGGEVRSPALGRGGEQDDLVASSVDRDDADHIASWHPAVALAVADWLEQEALIRETSGRERLCYGPALAAARAYLGEES